MAWGRSLCLPHAGHYDAAMRIVDSERVLFVHVPKTGGLTIQSVLERAGSKCARCQALCRAAGITR